MVVYTDNAYGFTVRHPKDFVVRTLSAAKLTQLKPMPDASFIFMNPETASSDVVDIEPADLEIRVYDAGQETSLDSWLTSNRVVSAGDTVQPFRTAHVSGVEVCASPMIAPGCSYFIVGSGWIYQLIPATLAGEAMINTFQRASI